MEVILRENISSLGKVGDIVKVKNGYARNYLFPKRLAYLATEVNRTRIEKERQALEAKETGRHSDATTLAQKIEAVTLSIAKQVGEEDKLYGSVSASDIAEALEKQGVEIDRKMVAFGEAIKTAGEHTVHIHIHAEVVANCKLTVVAL